MASNDSENLHGNAPDNSPAALLIIDMINDLEFDDGEQIAAAALGAAQRIADLKRRAKAAGMAVIYSNDNFGRWRSDFREVVSRVLEDGVRGEPLARLLQPEHDDYFVIKPKHSAFFETTLETLLRYLGVKRLVLTGITGDICLLLTASDAYMRDYEIYVPVDCTASVEAQENEHAARYMERVLKAHLCQSSDLDISAIMRPVP
ncbi:MAG TPA: isochorismatase family cysteine hydrolase [Longimicrobiales bacterium]